MPPEAPSGSTPGRSAPPRRSSSTFLSPWRLSWVALVLFALYGTIVLGSSLPLQLLDPAWQLRLCAVLVNASGFPLVGLGLLHLAGDLRPEDERVAGRRRLCARLAVGVALGFLLLIPLQSMALVQQSSSAASRRLGELQRGEKTIGELRQAVAGATSASELQERLQVLRGPRLSPAELSLPLPLLQQQLQTALLQAEQRLPRPQAIRVVRWELVGTGLRNGIACLALAIGFAALGQRRRSPDPFLKEWQQGWLHLLGLWRRPGAAARRSPEGRIASYFEEISQGDPPPSP